MNQHVQNMLYFHALFAFLQYEMLSFTIEDICKMLHVICCEYKSLYNQSPNCYECSISLNIQVRLKLCMGICSMCKHATHSLTNSILSSVYCCKTNILINMSCYIVINSK